NDVKKEVSKEASFFLLRMFWIATAIPPCAVGHVHSLMLRPRLPPTVRRGRAAAWSWQVPRRATEAIDPGAGPDKVPGHCHRDRADKALPTPHDPPRRPAQSPHASAGAAHRLAPPAMDTGSPREIAPS